MAESPSQNYTPQKAFGWTANRVEAAVFVAEDTLTNDQIAERCGVSAKTLSTWKKHPDFIARVDELIAELQERARRRGLARLDKRQDAAFDRHRRMVRLIDARASGYPEGHAHGGDTGLIVAQEKSIGSGEYQDRVTEYQFDAALMRELRELEKQIAQDAGQWSEKREVTGAGSQPLVVTFLTREDGPQ